MFSSGQTEGKELPTLTEVNGDVSGYRERLFKFVAAQSVELSFSERIAPAKGLSHGGKITLLAGMQPAEEFSTLGMDCSRNVASGRSPHTDHQARLRNRGRSRGLCSLPICRASNGTSSQDYIQLWRGDANLLRESLEAVQQTAAVILGGIAPESPALATAE